MEEKKSFVTDNNLNDYIYLNDESLEEISIEEGIKKIGTRAFESCKSLKKIKFPDSLEYIGASAFSGCENLEEIVLPKNIERLDYRAFADCRRLKKIIIPEGIQYLGFGLFSGCENLEEIVLPNSIEKIEPQIFLNCKKLKNVVLPKNLKSLPKEFFKGCENLNIKLDSNIEILEDEVFNGCYRQSYFPENVHKFGNNCFKNCKNLKEVSLNEKIENLPNGMFDGCVNLNKINYGFYRKLPIGQRCFKNCISLKEVPNFIYNFNLETFKNCIGLTSVNIIDNYVHPGCFMGCKNIKEISNLNNINGIGAYAFSGCDSIEEIRLENINYLSTEAFSNCKKLKKVLLNNNLKRINLKAFFNCENLEYINIPDYVEVIEKEAFKNCSSIKKITIPANLKVIKAGAFSYMSRLECIDVSPYNKTFITPDHKILINDRQQRLVLYAQGLKDKSYSLKEYNVHYDELNRSLIKPLEVIGAYAFAGAKNLEELTLCACTKDIETSAFIDCNNLKKLNVEAIDLFTCPGFHMRKNGFYYYRSNDNSPCYLPFEKVEFKGDLVQIFPNALENFVNVKEIILPNDKKYSISSGAFSDCSMLKVVKIPECVSSIMENSFNPSTKLIFKNGLEVTNFESLNFYDDYFGKYKLYTLKDGTYYIEKNGKITTITKKQISDICTNASCIINNPVLFLDFMHDLEKHDLVIKPLLDGILISNISKNNREILFNNLKKNDEFTLNVLKNSGLLDKEDSDTKALLEDNNLEMFFRYVKVLKKYNITNPLLHNKIFMANYDIYKFEKLIRNDLDLFIKIISCSNLLEPIDITLTHNNIEDNKKSYYVTYEILKDNRLEKFIDLIKKYNIKDKYLYQKTFIANMDNPLMEDLFKGYDANIKRLLKSSTIITNNLNSMLNLSNLLNLLKITGALENNPIMKQRASTFINEKMFAKTLPNGEKNEYRIVGDDIHRIFDFPYLRDALDYEFANFFLENYKELYRSSHLIQRIYLNFKEISKTCTSIKGSQRKLKVTMNKCINFLANNKFDDVSSEERDFAYLIACWYDHNSSWLKAKKIYKESLNAPRNIFTKIKVDLDGNIIYDNNRDNDLKEDISPNYSFEWLPKQDYDNLILGKYCNCCACIDGAGEGIMRASMILDNCQNLVVRNEDGTIISKATIYVNKNEGYAVFNTVETSINYRKKEDLNKIYRAFLRGTKAFIEIYNKNNKDFPIIDISVGGNRNTLEDFLTDENHPKCDTKKSLYYGKYSINGSGYNGDWNNNQRLVLKI